MEKTSVYGYIRVSSRGFFTNISQVVIQSKTQTTRLKYGHPLSNIIDV